MKKPFITIGLLIMGAVTPALAQDDARIAALEAKVRMLETQNLSLKAAVETISGKTLSELLAGVAPAADQSAVDQSADGSGQSAAMKDTAKEAAIAEMKTRIAAAEKVIADEDRKKNDPFAEKGGINASKADLEKRRALQNRAIAEMKAQLAALEN